MKDFELIEALLSSKDFDQLAPQEKAQVLSVMSAEEYRQYRLVLQQSRPLMTDAPAPAPALEGQLRAAFKAKYSTSPPLWQQALQYRLPLWQPLLAIAALLAWMILRPAPTAPAPPPPAWIVYQVDTVYLPIVMTTPEAGTAIGKKPKGPRKKLSKPIPAKPKPAIAASSVPERVPVPKTVAMEGALPIQPPVRQQVNGRNAREEPALLEALVRVY